MANSPKRLRIIWLFVSFLLVAGCTHVSQVDTEPQGAKVYLDGKYIGDSPVRVTLDKGFMGPASHSLKIEKEGHVTFLQTIQEGVKYDVWSGNTTGVWPDKMFWRLVPKKE